MTTMQMVIMLYCQLLALALLLGRRFQTTVCVLAVVAVIVATNIRPIFLRNP